MKEDIDRKVRQLKTNLYVVETISDFFDSLMDRRPISGKEVEETKLKMKYAKEQMMEACLKNKKLLLLLEQREMP